jgi:hypothetical protein
MLVDHAYFKVVGVVGVIYFDDLAVFVYYYFLRLIKAEQHTHQSRLSRAVLAEQSVYFAFFKLQRDVVVGYNSGEYLGDVQHFDYIFRFRQTSHSL